MTEYTKLKPEAPRANPEISQAEAASIFPFSLVAFFFCFFGQGLEPPPGK